MMTEEEKNNYYYQAFWFKNEIKDFFYADKLFENYKPKMGMSDSVELAVNMSQDKESFMPELVLKIEWLLGKGNFEYDFWEFGDEDFSLYWFIKKEVYYEKMKLIDEWVRYEKFEHLMFFDIEDDINKQTEYELPIPLEGGFFDDDGNKLDLKNIPIPDLCKSCESFDSNDWEDDVLCNLNRFDQKAEKDFKCGAYEKRGF
ncbi:MAG: hypothetical protein KAH25_05460 [Bacteroidales bacterium]|nr:hypothetical protein [Bacteroidales bacterium]